MWVFVKSVIMMIYILIYLIEEFDYGLDWMLVVGLIYVSWMVIGCVCILLMSGGWVSNVWEFVFVRGIIVGNDC